MLKKGRKILIRADGNKRIGMGHIHRGISIAEYMRMRYGCLPFFVIRSDKAAAELLKIRHLKFYAISPAAVLEDEISALRRIIARDKPGVIIIDLLKYVDSNYIRALRSNEECIITVFTDGSEKLMIASDMVFAFNPNQKTGFYSGSTGTKYRLGSKYLILNEDYLRIPSRKEFSDEINKIVVCMGGTDQHDLTFRVLNSIDKSRNHFNIEVMFNSVFFPRKQTMARLSGLRHKASAFFDVKSLLKHFADCDMAVTAGGITHMERLCAGVPGLVIDQSARQNEFSASAMRKGATAALGLYDHVSGKKILKEFDRLYSDVSLRKRMAIKGRQLVDGKGLKRVAELIDNAAGMLL